MEESLQSQIAKELSRRARERSLNMAVVGCAGEGKSALVNSLLLFDADHSGVAEEGDVETTTIYARRLSRKC